MEVIDNEYRYFPKYLDALESFEIILKIQTEKFCHENAKRVAIST